MIVAAALLAVAIALRAADWGNPVIHVDEQYYLLVGTRMLHGAVPYLDIWDRKPIGLFLLYAMVARLPGDGILAYQLAATASAWLTATVIARGARELGAAPRGAVAAGALYLLGLTLLGGRGGQAPVFYNLLMAGAGLLTLRLPRFSRVQIAASGAAACLLAGLAIQMKYTPAVEGAFFGLAHLWWLRRRGGGPVRLVVVALPWGLLGLAPTLAAIGWYMAKGPAAFHAFWFANFSSISLRPGYPPGQLAMRLLGIFAQLAPLAVCAIPTWRQGSREPAVRLAFGWLVAALGGFLVIGTFFDHYALPLLVPLTLVAAPTLGRSSRALVATLVLAGLLALIERAALPHDAAGARQVAQVVRAGSGGECPYVFIGDTITYQLAETCLPTAYAFPNLLAYTTEQGATGIDESAEVARILARRPPVIVTSDRKLDIWNRRSKALVDAAIASRYRLVLATPRAGWHTLVYRRRDLPAPR